MLNENYTELEITSIEIINEDIEMVDIEVEDDHTFCITPNNIISHNCNSMIKGCTVPALKTQCSLIVLNHVYDDPGAMYASKIKSQSGGKGIQYMASLSVQCSRRLEKGEEKDDNFYETTVLKFFTIKNRGGCRPFLETEVPLSFTKGFVGTEYYGLIPVAIQLGFIKSPKQGWYQVPSYGETMLRIKDLYGGPKAKEIWDTFIKDFDEESKKQISYSNMTDIEAALNDEISSGDELETIVEE